MLRWLNAVSPGLALGEATGRLSCLSASCCYGQLCGLHWAITFTDPRSLVEVEPLNMPLHLTQISHSLAGLAAFAFILIIRNRLQRPNQLMGLLLALFCLTRFSIEYFRADFRDTLGPFGVPQLLYVGFLILGLIILCNKRTARS